MTSVCAWCGCLVPAKRRGRQGARKFCSLAHQRKHTTLALQMGQRQLDRDGRPAEAVARLEHCLINSGARSSAIPPSPSEAAAPFVVRQ